jgi:hypothetical protein
MAATIPVRHHLRIRQILTLALTAAWLAMVACADAHPTPALHRSMPCCPPNAGTQECSLAQCEQAPEKTEIRSGDQAARLPVADAADFERPVTLAAEALRELTPGLRFSAAVFRLKDDLRI